MKLMTKGLINKLPPLYSNELKEAKDTPIVAKFFDPCGSWTWYATEGEVQESGDIMFYGYVRGFHNEPGYFMLSELESIKRPFGLGIERDIHFGKRMLSEAMASQI